MPALAAYLSISNCCVFSSLQLTYTSVIAVQGCNASVFLQAAKDLHKLGPKYVLIKGGHLIAAPSDPTRSSSDSQPSPSSARSQTPSAGSVAQDSESASASSAAQDSESASASSAAQDSESASARDCNIAQDATHDSNQSVSELSADSSLGEGHLQGQALSQHTDGGGAEQDTDQHNGELGQVQPVSPLVLAYAHFAQLGTASATCGCCSAWQAALIQQKQPRRLSCPLTASCASMSGCACVRVCALHASKSICIHACFHCTCKVIVILDCTCKTVTLDYEH